MHFSPLSDLGQFTAPENCSFPVPVPLRRLAHSEQTHHAATHASECQCVCVPVDPVSSSKSVRALAHRNRRVVRPKYSLSIVSSFVSPSSSSRLPPLKLAFQARSSRSGAPTFTLNLPRNSSSSFLTSQRARAPNSCGFSRN